MYLTLYPYSALLLTSYCAVHIKVSARLRTGFALAKRAVQREVGGVTHRVVCTWQLLGLAIWLTPGGPILALAA